jgi:hypothetical protein
VGRRCETAVWVNCRFPVLSSRHVTKGGLVDESAARVITLLASLVLRQFVLVLLR